MIEPLLRNDRPPATMQGRRVCVRLFYALTFPASVRLSLIRLQDHIRSSAVRGNFTRKENIHLTLAFIGEVPSSEVTELCSVLDQLDGKPFTLSFNRIGFFGRDIWWTGAAYDPDLASLQGQLETKLRTKGYRVEERPFAAHITLARQVRLGGSIERRQVARPITPIPVKCNRISLMESTRIDGRLTYVELHGRPL